ncbi:MAG TPA: chorismate synthase [Bacillota bacterium]|nr:chorismate synthase [Clostridiales bacterium]HPT85097.1 chorismate synthase [Bacillota bacterium]
MASEFGYSLKITVYGQSHGEAVGAVADGLPAGEPFSLERLAKFMARRRPGAPLTTGRREPDAPEFVSGVLPGERETELVTCGSPLCAIIRNTDARPSDYSAFADTPRPGHADYTAYVKWGGKADMRGGGHFSGRLTAPICAIGGIALQILERRDIYVGAHLEAVGGISDARFPLLPTKQLFDEIAGKAFPVIDDACGKAMQKAIAEAAAELDSIGGIVECAIVGLPAGLGSPMFDGVESMLSRALFGIPAVKGVEFGNGFAGSASRGSQNNDPFVIAGGKISAETNNSGGILGGITTGMPVVFRVAFKPTPTIGKPQRTVYLSRNEPAILEARGRHDPCVALRAVPVVEAVAALVTLDLLLSSGYFYNTNC